MSSKSSRSRARIAAGRRVVPVELGARDLDAHLVAIESIAGDAGEASRMLARQVFAETAVARAIPATAGDWLHVQIALPRAELMAFLLGCDPPRLDLYCAGEKRSPAEIADSMANAAALLGRELLLKIIRGTGPGLGAVPHKQIR